MELFSWGANSHGQLGQNNKEDTSLPKKADVTNVKNKLVCIAGGGGHTAIVTESGDLFLCGQNDQGQLGDSTLEMKPSEVLHHIPSLIVHKVACGWDFTLAILSTGQLWGWGSNSFGQIAQDIMCKKTLHPMILESLKGIQFIDVSAGLRHAASLSTSKDVWTWGNTKKGQIPAGCLENEASGGVSKPVRVTILKKIESLHCGAFFTILRTENGELYGWGDNSKGQLTQDPLGTHMVDAVFKLNVPRCFMVATGWSHAIAILGDGQVASWGRGDYGQLGRPISAGFDHRQDKVELPAPTSQVCCGSEHSLAVTEDGCLFAWGWNEHGMCAKPEAVGIVSTPVLVHFGPNVKVESVAAGAGHSLAYLQCAK